MLSGPSWLNRFERRFLPEIRLDRIPQPAARPGDGGEQQRRAYSDHEKNDFPSVATDLPEGGELRNDARELDPVGNRYKEHRKQEDRSDHQRGNQWWELPVPEKGTLSTTGTSIVTTVRRHR